MQEDLLGSRLERLAVAQERVRQGYSRIAREGCKIKELADDQQPRISKIQNIQNRSHTAILKQLKLNN